VGLLTAVTAAISLSSGAAAFIAVGNAGIRCRTTTAIVIAGLHQAAMIGYFLIWRPGYPFWAVWLVSMSEYAVVLIFGLYLRARRQLIASLHERVAQAEATQHATAEQARLTERARIAGEMHDVLAHRVSLIALHAGALEIRPGQAADSVRETAGLIRQTARQALTELRDVIGVLSDAAAAPRTPQPTLGTIPSLVGEYQRAGLKMILSAVGDLRVTGEAPDGAAALAAVTASRPDVVLMDIRMPDMDGIEATGKIRALPDPPQVIVLTTFHLDEYVFGALRAGAGGFLLKDTPPADIAAAVRLVAAGEAMLSPAVTRTLLERFGTDPAPDSKVAALRELTPRELEVATEVARGHSNAEIAAKLYMSAAPWQSGLHA